MVRFCLVHCFKPGISTAPLSASASLCKHSGGLLSLGESQAEHSIRTQHQGFVQRCNYVADGGITLDMAKMKAIRVDAEARLVTVQGNSAGLDVPVLTRTYEHAAWPEAMLAWLSQEGLLAQTSHFSTSGTLRRWCDLC